MNLKNSTISTDPQLVRRHFNPKIKKLIEKGKRESFRRGSYESPSSSMLRLIYDYGVKLTKQGSRDQFVKKADLYDANCDHKVDTDNIFAVIIERYIRGHTENMKGFELGSAQRSKYSRALAYAAKHNIPTNWLGAFLKEVGGYEKAARKYNLKTTESWVSDNTQFE